MRSLIAFLFALVFSFSVLAPAGIAAEQSSSMTRAEQRKAFRAKRIELARKRRVSSSTPASSSSSSAMSSSSSFAVEVEAESGNQVFLPFLKRYVTLPQEWSVTIGTDSAIFTRTTDGNKSGSLTVSLISQTECDTNAIQKAYRKRMSLPEEDVSLRVNYMRVPGWLGAGFTWVDGSTSGGNRQWCVIPPRRVGVSLIRADDGEGSVKEFIEKNLLLQLANEPKKGRR